MFPSASEHAPYFSTYTSLVTSHDILGTLRDQLPETLSLIRTLDPDLSYAPGKWTVRATVGHLIDTERVMAYRTLRIARGDQTPLPSFDQDTFAANAPYDGIPIEQILDEWSTVRQSTLQLLRPLSPEQWQYQAVCSNHPTSVRALAFIIAGHELHHRRIFIDRYTNA
jgi:hypothetical protein